MNNNFNQNDDVALIYNFFLCFLQQFFVAHHIFLLRKTCITRDRIAISLMIRMMISEAKDVYWFPAIVVLMPLFETQANNSTQLVWTTLRRDRMYIFASLQLFLKILKGNVQEVIGRYHYRMTLRILLLSLELNSLG